MEDNEFEEVTIISHTDQAASILPQQTAERLMKEIRMEVTQKISQTENVKMGSLQHSEASTLLDMMQPSLSQSVGNREVYQLRFLNSDKSELLVVSMTEIFRLNTNPPSMCQIQVPVSVEDDSSSSEDLFVIYNLGPAVCWREHLYLFKLRGVIEVYDLQFNHVKTISEQQFHFSRNSGVACTDDRLYFVSAHSSLLSINIEGQLQQNPFREVADFFIHRRTKKPVTINRRGEISFVQAAAIKTSTLAIDPIGTKYRLKQMYSDHFLVAVLREAGGHKLRLVDCKTMKLTSEIGIPEQPGVNPHEREFTICLLRPRLSLELVLFAQYQEVFLLWKKDSQLNLVSGTSVDIPNINTVLHLAGDTWLAAGKNCTICSIEVHFPDALKL